MPRLSELWQLDLLLDKKDGLLIIQGTIIYGVYWVSMGKRRQKDKKKGTNETKVFSKSVFSHIFAFIAGCMLCGVVVLLFDKEFSQAETNSPQTVDELLEMSEIELAELDIGLVNLICAKGLDDSENLDIQQCLATLDGWSEHIMKGTEARLPSYYNNPAKYDNSLHLFKVVTMVLCLKKDIGVDYNLDIMKRNDFPDSKDVFIHGCLSGKKQGGCVSIPTLCVAVGR